eukprot:g75481.t1
MGLRRSFQCCICLYRSWLWINDQQWPLSDITTHLIYCCPCCGGYGGWLFLGCLRWLVILGTFTIQRLLAYLVALAADWCPLLLAAQVWVVPIQLAIVKGVACHAARTAHSFYVQ